MKKVIAFIVAMLVLSTLSASALTIVRQDGQGGAQTSIGAAISVEPDGGTIQIQQFSTPFWEWTLNLSNRSLTCTAATRATIIAQQYDGMTINNGSISNIEMVGTSDNVAQMGLTAYYNVTINNCVIRGFRYADLNLRNPAGYTISVTNTYCCGPGYFDDGVVAICGTGPVTLDHCTLYGNKVFGGGSYANIYFWSNWDGLNPGYNASNVTIKNCIIDGCDRAIGAYYLANFAPVHRYNDLYPNWDYIKYNWENNNLALDATEKASVDPLYVNAGAYDFHLQGGSALIGQGENGSNIGADTPPPPVLIKQDSTGNFTTISAAIAGTADGANLSIAQFYGAFNEGSLSLGNRILTSSTSPKPTINFSSGAGLSVVGGQVKNVKLVGTNGGYQNGLTITGSATVDNCEITQFGNRAMTISVPAGQSCSVTNSYFYKNPESGCAVGIDDKGTVMFNHNTIVLDSDDDCIDITSQDASYTASNITIKNCILRGGAVGVAAYYLTNLALNHSYNDLSNWWKLMYYNQTNSELALGTGEIKNVDPMFRAPAQSDYRISPMSSCCGTGESAGNMGADTVTAKNTTAPTAGDLLYGVDGAGRVLSTNATAGNPKTGRYAILFYFLWMGPGVNSGPYDVTQILAANPNNPQWGNDGGNGSGTWHWWGQPELGYYYSNDQYVLRQHAQMLADAKVDAIIFDNTNGYTYPDTYLTLCQVFQNIRDHGGTTPQIAFLVKDQTTANTVYNNLYATNKYPGLWFQWGGKPLMVSDEWYSGYSTTLRNFFTWRQSWAWTTSGRPYYNGWYGANTSGKYKWPWLDDYPQKFGWSTASNKVEQFVANIAQHPDKLSYPNYQGIGRSYTTSQPSPTNPGPLSTTPNGVYFAQFWSRGLSQTNWETNAIVWVTSWNEWIAQRQIAVASGEKCIGVSVPIGGTWFCDQYTQEYSRDGEPMTAGHTDNYYYQMVDNIRKFKGVTADQVSNAPITITIDGGFSDWDSVSPVYRDYVGDAWQRNTKDWNNLAYNNNTGRNDFSVLKVTNDANNVYFYAECVDNISPYTDANWMWLLVNKDNTWTNGWNGYDYMVNYGVTNSTQTTLKSSTSGWSWTTVSSTISYRVSGNKMEIAIPRTSLGLPASGALNFSFKWADNAQATDDIIQFATNGDSAPNRRFAYHYKSNS